MKKPLLSIILLFAALLSADAWPWSKPDLPIKAVITPGPGGIFRGGGKAYFTNESNNTLVVNMKVERKDGSDHASAVLTIKAGETVSVGGLLSSSLNHYAFYIGDKVTLTHDGYKTSHIVFNAP